MTTATTIKLTKCNPELVKKTLTGLKLATGGSLKACVERLAAYYEENASKFDIATCDVCCADSDAALASCPFCGDVGPIVTEDETPAEPPPNPEVESESTPESTEVIEEEPPTQEEQPPMRSKSKKKAVTAKAKPEPKKAPAAAKAKPEPKKTGTKRRVVEHPDQPFNEATGEVIAAPTPDSHTAELVTVSDLDSRIAIIRQCESEGAVALHRLGATANEIATSGMWKLRVNKKGVSLYRNFKQFCVEELKNSHTHIYRAMKVAGDYTEKQVAGLSGQQIRLVLQVPKEAREEVLAAAKSGESKSQLTERANALRGGTAAPAPKPKNAVTVAMAMGHTKVRMFKRPTTGGAKVGDTENAKPAKSLKDNPWLALDLANKVRLMVRVSTNPKGEIVADVEFRRGEPVL